MLHKNTYLVILFLIIVSATSCGGLIKSMALSRATVEKNAIPSYFGVEANAIILCVLRDIPRYDDKMKHYVSNNYFGKYEFVSSDDLHKLKYQNKDIYRYSFDHTMTSSTGYYNGRSYQYSMPSFHIYDRKKREYFKCTMAASNYGKLIEAYMINLEKVRVNNQTLKGNLKDEY